MKVMSEKDLVWLGTEVELREAYFRLMERYHEAYEALRKVHLVLDEPIDDSGDEYREAYDAVVDALHLDEGN